jgi:hypothetical protein
MTLDAFAQALWSFLGTLTLLIFGALVVATVAWEVFGPREV